MTDSTAQPTPSVSLGEQDLQAVERLKSARDLIRRQMGRVIVGQEHVIDELLIALFSGGHCILEGVPGLAKTLMVSTLSRSLSLAFSRIQFTPDLMPTDITGTEVIQEDKATGTRAFKFLSGPIFANVILADEINRTPPKTQAALLEAMQERQVTVGGERHPLDPPFFVLATQNPIEQEGTYPLPEAQQDRFMFKIHVDYPTYEQEYEIAEKTTAEFDTDVEAGLTGAEIVDLQHMVRRVPVAPHVIRHALDLTRVTRPADPNALEIIQRMVSWGAGPRAVQFLVLGAKARAILNGRYHASTDDVRAIAHPVLRHRVITNFSAEAEGYSTDRIVDEILGAVQPTDSILTTDPALSKAVKD